MIKNMVLISCIMFLLCGCASTPTTNPIHDQQLILVVDPYLLEPISPLSEIQILK